LVVIGGLGLTGACLQAVVEPVWQAHREAGVSISVDSIPAATVRHVSFGVLGGFRAVAADLAWLRAYVAWEKRDAPATESLLQLATVLDGRPLYFWLNGARMTAYDIPAWQIDEAGGCGVVSPAEQKRIVEKQARRALSSLEVAMTYHPTSAALWIERANIELNRLDDPESAAESYRRASEQPGAPYYPARLHAELLRRLGHKAEALVWLVKLYPRLPKEVEAAAAGLVLTRIRSLETELLVAPEKRFSLAESNTAPPDRSLTQIETER
jgi:hypothetical protein